MDRYGVMLEGQDAETSPAHAKPRRERGFEFSSVDGSGRRCTPRQGHFRPAQCTNAVVTKPWVIQCDDSDNVADSGCNIAGRSRDKGTGLHVPLCKWCLRNLER